MYIYFSGGQEMVCKACGHINQDNMAKFCSACGSELQQESQNTVYQESVYYQPPPQRVPNYLIFSILTTVFCCLPIGIAAIIKSSQVDKKVAIGEYDEAIKMSQQAKTLSILSVILGVVFVIFYIIIIAITSTALR